MFNSVDIIRRFQNEPSIKWRLLNEIGKTRSLLNINIQLKNNIMHLNGNPILKPWDILSHVMPIVHKNQHKGNLNEISDSIFEAVNNLDLFKNLKNIIKVQIVHCIVSILGSLYLISKDTSDIVSWTLALAGLVSSIILIVSMCKVKKKFSRMLKTIQCSGLTPDLVTGVVETLISTTLLQDDPCSYKQCSHTACEILKREDFNDLLHCHTIKYHNKDVEKFLGKGDFAGCIVDDGDIITYFPIDKNQNVTTLLGPSFSAVIAVVYVLGVAGMTYSGYSDITSLLKLARLKNEIKTSVKDIKDFIKFVASDLCDIDISGEKALLSSLDKQIIENQKLIQLRPVEYIERPELFYDLRTAETSSRDKMRNLSSNSEIRSSQLALTNLLGSTLNALADKKRVILELQRSMDIRPDVHVTFLHGMAGVGKTSVAKYIHESVSKTLGIRPEIYNINFPANGHWPAYAGQANATYDEFGARKQDDPFLCHFNAFASSGYFSMDGADLAYKPQPCAVRHIILLGNTARWPLMNTLSKGAVAAMWSRMKTYHVQFPNMTSRYDTAGRQPDFSHLTFVEEVYSNIDNDHKVLSSADSSLQAIVDDAVLQCRKHLEKFQIDVKPKLPLDINQSLDTNHLVFNVHGPSGRGKTQTFQESIGPQLSTYTRLPLKYVSSVGEMKKQKDKCLYLIDDILTSSATQQTIQSYVEFYNSIPFGSIIVLISNMIPHHSLGCQKSYIPLPYWKRRLPDVYHSNDAVLRRMGLEGWVDGKTAPVFSPSVGTDIYFCGRPQISGENLSINDLVCKMQHAYYDHLQHARSFSIVETDQIFEPTDDNYVRIKMDRHELAAIVSKGGLQILKHLGTGIIIPDRVMKNFRYNYPVEQFQFNSNDPTYMLELAPKLLTIFRRTCPEGEIYVDLGDMKLLSQGKLLKICQDSTTRIRVTAFTKICAGEKFIILRTGTDNEGTEKAYTYAQVFSWYEGDILSLPPQGLTTMEIETLRSWVVSNPCAFRSLQRDKTWAFCQGELAAIHSRILPSAIQFATKLPVLEIITAIAAIAFSSWIISRIVQSYKTTTDKNQVLIAAGSSKSTPEPDVNAYLKKGFVEVPLSKDTLHMFDMTAYDADMGRWTRAHNQVLKTPLVHHDVPEDVVAQALIKAAVKCSTVYGSLHGVMTHGKFGVTNAHLYGVANYHQPVSVLDFRFDVEHDGRCYQASVTDYIPSYDICIFQVLEIPSFPDIRSFFFSHSELKNGLTYPAALLKHRKVPMLEKCNVTYDLMSSPYYNAETKTGVKNCGLSIRFITSEDTCATNDGDCGSFYITMGTVHGVKQHTRILGMHVGLRAQQYPYATVVPRELLQGRPFDKNQGMTLPSTKSSIPKNFYNIQGVELMDDFLLQIIGNLERCEDPFQSTIQVLGRDKKQYIEPLTPSRQPTGFNQLVVEKFPNGSGVAPTSTCRSNLQLDHCLKNSKGYPDILLTQFQAYGSQLPSYDKKLLAWCTKSVKTYFQTLYTSLESPITTMELFNGFPAGHPRHGTVNKINLDSSAGIYFKRKYNVSKKSEFFLVASDGTYTLRNTPAAADYFSRANDFVRNLTMGYIPQTITKTCLKSELRPLTKVEKGVIRTFDSADASLVLAHRMLLMGTMSSVQCRERRMKSPIQIGINALEDFPELVKRLRSKGGKLLQFDFTEFDRRLNVEIIEAAYDVALSIQKPDADHSTLAKALAFQTCCSIRMVGNTVLRTCQGISSGFYFTSLGDSIANYINLLYVVVKATNNQDFAWFLENIDAVILGDDISIRVSEQLSQTLSISRILEEYHSIGSLPTAADKESQVLYQDFSDFAFCSRTIRLSRNGIILPPLKMRTILGLLEWVTPSHNQQFLEGGKLCVHSTNHQIVDNLNLALAEASLHPKHQFDKVVFVCKRIVAVLRAQRVSNDIINKVDLYSYHDIREKLTEDTILGRKSLNNSYKKLFQFDQFDQNQSKMTSVTLTMEWCAQFKLPIPIITRHTDPKDGSPSTCDILVTWEGETRTFSGCGTNKKCAKVTAFDQLVDAFNIVSISSTSLSNFCNLKMKEMSLIKTSYYDGTEFVVMYQPMKEGLPSGEWMVHGRSDILSVANFHAMKNLRERDVYHETTHPQMETGSSIPVHSTANAGLSMTSQPAQPPMPSADITPHIMAAPLEQAPLVTMQGGPVAVVQTPNILKPADMLTFGAVDFTVADAARNQVIDHNPNIAISQGAIRGQVIAVDDYNPYNKNIKIQEWVNLHQRYVGGIVLRYHLIANPIFMGEIAIAWLPDVRGVVPGQVIEDSVFQLYSWKTISLREGATEFMTLEDARQNQFYRTNDIAGEDATLTRPGIVVVIYQPMVNPFDNQQAACYLNIGSVLAADFRPSNPVSTNRGTSPTGPQTPSSNSLEGNTFGTVFSSVGVFDAPEVFMTTDGVNFPSQNAPTVVPSSRNLGGPPLIFGPLEPYDTATPITPDNGVFATIGHQQFSTQVDMETSYQISQITQRTYANPSSIYLEGSFPSSLSANGQLNWSLAGATFDECLSRFSSTIGSLCDSVSTQIVVSGSVLRILTTSVAVLNNFTNVITVCAGSHTLRVYFINHSFGLISGGIYLRQGDPFVLGPVNAVAYNYPLLNLPTNTQLVRFGLKSFPVISYTVSQQPSIGHNSFEQEVYAFFNTITTTTGGFVQFALVNAETAQVVCTLRFDHNIGFTLLSLQSVPFRQWNGFPVNNLVFRNVQFGNRSVVFPLTDTSSWASRFSPVVLKKRIVQSAILASYIASKTVPAVPTQETELQDMIFSMKISRLGERHFDLTHNQSMPGMIIAGALGGAGSGFSSWQNQNYQSRQNQLDRDFAEKMKNLGFTQQEALQQQKFGLEADLYGKYRAVDMRTKLQMAGAIAPISQTFAGRGGSPISNPTGARPFVPSPASQAKF